MKTNCFKPYYNWNTFNTIYSEYKNGKHYLVLNLIITGIPSILKWMEDEAEELAVLNLIITGIPSIQN